MLHKQFDVWDLGQSEMSKTEAKCIISGDEFMGYKIGEWVWTHIRRSNSSLMDTLEDRIWEDIEAQLKDPNKEGPGAEWAESTRLSKSPVDLRDQYALHSGLPKPVLSFADIFFII